MYLHKIEKDLNNGKKVRRAAWPKNHHIAKLPGSQIDLTDEERKQVGLSKEAEVSIADTLIYIEEGKKATVGFQLAHEDKNSQDWEFVK